MRHKKHSRSLCQLIREVVGQHPVRGAEIGVFRGENSLAILENFPRVTLILVDTWKEWPADHPYRKNHNRSNHCSRSVKDYKEGGMGGLNQDQWDGVYNEVVDRCDKYNALIVRKTSEQAAKFVVVDNSLDFVFIDADHTYEGVKKDIELWLPKVRLGGLISGHDYHQVKPRGKYKWGVIEAVDEAFGKQNVVAMPGLVWGVKK